LYRGIPEGLLASLKVGDEIREPGFTSTSPDKGVAEGFGKPVKLTVPAGTKGAYIDAVARSGEAEFLLPRGARFKVTSISAGIPHLEMVTNVTANTRFKFNSDPEKVKAFQDWLRQLRDRTYVEIRLEDK
jgi:hypothetical protein